MILQTLKRMANGEHVLIVAVGDSITEQNYHLHGHLNFVGIWHEQWLEKYGRRLMMINSGVSGNTSVNLLERLERDVLRFNPDLVSIMIGINDSGKGISLQNYKDNLEKLIHSIREAGSEVLLLTPHPIRIYETETASRYSSYPEFVEGIRESAEKMDVALCDIHKEWILRVDDHKHLSLMNDWIHPNERGHRLMADILIEQLSRSEMKEGRII